MSKKHLLAKNYSLQVLYQILLFLTPLITLPYISRVLGPENIGIYAYDYSILNYFIVLSALGINNYGNRSISCCKNKNEVSDKFWEIWYMHLILSIASIILYVLFYSFIIETTSFLPYILILFLLGNLFDISWLFLGLENMGKIVLRNSIIKIISIILMFLLVKNSNDLWMYYLIMGSSSFVGSILLWVNLGKYINYKKPTTSLFNHLKPLSILAIPVLSYSLYRYIDKIMIGSIISKTELGFYEYSEKVFDISYGLIMPLGTVLLPRISSYINDKRDQDVEKIAIFSSFFHWSISSALAFGMIAVSKDIVLVLMGERYLYCTTLIDMFGVILLFSSWSTFYKNIYFLPNKKDKYFVIIMIIGAAVNIISNVFLIPEFGAVGAAFGTIISEFTIVLLQYCFTSHKKIYKKMIFINVPFIFSGILMLMLLCFININLSNIIFSLIIKILIGGVFYIILIAPYVIRILKKENYIKK